MGKLRHWGTMPVKLPFNYSDRSLKCRSKVPPQKCLYLKMINVRDGYHLMATSVYTNRVISTMKNIDFFEWEIVARFVFHCFVNEQ